MHLLPKNMIIKNSKKKINNLSLCLNVRKKYIFEKY